MKTKNRIWVYILVVMGFVLMFANSCKKDDSNNNYQIKNVPVLVTSPVINITNLTASSGGNITSDEGHTVSARGVCWSTGTTPTIADSKTNDGAGAGSFTSLISGLIGGTTYYVRAYATNSEGTGYGSALSFSVLTVTTCPATIADVDGNTYNTVEIGNQCWMRENLKTLKYRDNSVIPNITDSVAWVSLTTGAYCDYNNTAHNSDTYGRLYNWFAATDAHNLCPTGWHVPTDAEWTTLTTFLGGESVAGGKLKEEGYTHWNSPNSGADNSSGFRALPGGFRYTDGTFNDIGQIANWWSTAEIDTYDALFRGAYYSGASEFRTGDGKVSGISVRCLRDL